MKYLVSILLLFVSIISFAQVENIDTLDLEEVILAPPIDKSSLNEDSIYVFVEDPPEFPGGDSAMMKYLADNIKYPDSAKRSRIQGIVYISFIIERDGNVGFVKILRGVSDELDEESIRVVRGMPKWKPGKHSGKDVRTQYNIPIRYKLKDRIYYSPDSVDVVPKYIGSNITMDEHLRKTIKYPESALRYEIQGTVHLSFTIEKDGSISNIKNLKPVGGGLDEEAIRVIKTIPKMKPAMIDGKAVRYQYYLPVKFKLSL